MSMRYFDAHCHVQFDPYDADREELLLRMQEESVGGVVVGVDRDSSEKAIALVEKHPHLYASVGLHPNYETQEVFDATHARLLAQHEKVVAIGECGLDYYRPEEVTDALKSAQKKLLEAQIEVAVQANKPLIIHGRPAKGSMDAYTDLIDILSSKKKEYGDTLRADIHFFVGGVEEARAFVSLDCTVSFTAVITFARDYDDVIRFVPQTHILSETDSPYVAPAGRRGKRNDPLAVIEVARTLAEIRGEQQETLEKALVENAQRLFGV